MIEDDPNYIQSNNLNHIFIGFSQEAKNMYNKYRELSNITTKHLQDIADEICKEFVVVNVVVKFVGVQPHKHRGKRLKQKTLGTYHRLPLLITIHKYTAVKRKQITPKVAINTLLHELNHHIDICRYMLKKSIHSGGFYRRIGQLQDMLK